MNAFAVIIPAAGSGKRFGGGDKLLVDLAGRSVLQRTVALFAHRNDVAQVIVVTAPERFADYRNHLSDIGVVAIDLVAGGAERFDSVQCGLAAVRAGIEFVAIHDGARPLTPRHVINEAFAAAIAVGGSLPVVPEPATLKRVGPDGLVVATVDRSTLAQAQTPQCFRLSELRAAFAALAANGQLTGLTDDAQVFERCGKPVRATPGDASNLKITTAADAAVGGAILASRSIGEGD
jgi:2-C-methyl-D-erythritol 4-phosphate cytidylyltransferase